MKRLVILVLATTLAAGSIAQPVSTSDYNRAVSFLWDNVNNKKAFNLHVIPNWNADSTGVWFVLWSKEGKSYQQVSFKSLQKTPLFDHALLAQKLTELTKAPVNSTNLDLTNVARPDANTLRFSFRNKRLIWDTKSSTLKADTAREIRPNPFEAKSPDGKWVAYTENYNLFIRSTADGTIKQLSKNGAKNYEYASYYGWSDIMEGENGDRPKRFYANWSPDSKWIQTSICDLRDAQKMYLLDWSVDTLYRARLLSYYRGSPGDKNVVHLVPVAFHIESGKEQLFPVPRIAHENGYFFSWAEKPGVGFMSYRDRGFQKANVLKLDLNNGTHTKIFTDSSKTNTHGFDYWISEKAGKLVVASERSGWKQLYTIDIASNFIKVLTSGEYVVRDVLYIDPKGKGTVYFLASGREPGRNPYQGYLYSVSLDGKNLKLLTPEEGDHVISLSPGRDFFVDNYSAPNSPTITVLRELKSGKAVSEISSADIRGLSEMNWKFPEAFTATGKDGKTPIYGLLWKPTNFDPSRKYPVIDHSYTGPHGNIVPGTFVRAVNINNQSLAELGFIVMMVDGLGTANRSKAFRDYSYKRMGYNLQDHVNAIRQLSKTRSWMDTTRVGIFGHSAGGYDAGHALLQFPDFYKVGVASSADHDFRMEKAWWPEMYMGWPVDSTYHEQSSITMAGNLKGKLLITHGGIDENVNPSATFKLAEMLVRANKQFDMLIFPSQKHGYTGPHQRYFMKTRWNYFVKHLLGEEPVWDFAWE
ncbi:MAG: prolyl oligopeptidase family serine peptidase [Cyclobacteriaceae bacterium]|nr:prolyl oligopeptidase family serine peptidase [Cyclobacteriaceae bacterium]